MRPRADLMYFALVGLVTVSSSGCVMTLAGQLSKVGYAAVAPQPHEITPRAIFRVSNSGRVERLCDPEVAARERREVAIAWPELVRHALRHDAVDSPAWVAQVEVLRQRAVRVPGPAIVAPACREAIAALFGRQIDVLLVTEVIEVELRLTYGVATDIGAEERAALVASLARAWRAQSVDAVSGTLSGVWVPVGLGLSRLRWSDGWPPSPQPVKEVDELAALGYAAWPVRLGGEP